MASGGRGGLHRSTGKRSPAPLAEQGVDRGTTLFDLYGLPGGFPEFEKHAGCLDTTERAELLEQAITGDLDDWRPTPYLQRHEFEALVLAGLDPLRTLLDAPEDIEGWKALSKEVGATPPEEIDDGEKTAPSKRLTRHIPSYQKALHGPLVVETVGLADLRKACPRFDGWVTKLEKLSR